MISLFITVIYQPFLNILVFFYWLLGLVMENPDMGIAVIFLTILIRFLLLPLSIAGERSEKERREISEKVKEIEEIYSDDPIRKEKERKKVLKTNRRVLFSELFNLTIQVTIAIMLWKIFATGLGGEDLHLIYSQMPDVHLPFNLMFLNRYDLTHTSLILNLIQSLLIFLLEVISLYSSPFPVSKKEVVRLQLVLPVVAFVIFMSLPAGKKLFVITSLSFSILFKLIQIAYRKFKSYGQEAEDEEVSSSDEIIVVSQK